MANSIFPAVPTTVTTTSPITGTGASATPIGLSATAGVVTFLATPSSANLAAAVTNETGSGALVFATSPALVTPDVGVATGTSVNLSGDVKGATFHVGAAAGVDASIVIPAVATITVTKGIITAVV